MQNPPAPILNDITVIDMTEGVAGPCAAMTLADMGANEGGTASG